jgi:flagellar hook-length control protein FliK
MEVRLRLHPESLGEVRVQVRWENGVLSARLETASSTARDALQSSAPALRDALQEQGIPLEHLTVSIRMDLETRSSSQDPGTQAGQGSPSDPASPAQSALRAEPEGETVPAGRVDVRI